MHCNFEPIHSIMVFSSGAVRDHFPFLDWLKIFTEYFFHQTSSNERVCDEKIKLFVFWATLLLYIY